MENFDLYAYYERQSPKVHSENLALHLNVKIKCKYLERVKTKRCMDGWTD